MKKVFFAAALVVAAFGAQAQEISRPSAVVGQTYGEKIKAKGAIDINKVPELLAADDDKKINVKVKAKVVDVCKKKGCWANLELEDKSTIFVKMKDYAFFLPDDAVGKYIVLEGEASEKVTSVNELRHYAEDAGKSQDEIEKITEPKKEIRFMASGIVVPKQ